MLLGLVLLVVVLLFGRWFVNADPKLLAKTLKRTALVLILGVVAVLAVSGRLTWAFMALPVLLPWLLRIRSLARTAKNYSRMASNAGPGGTSEVKTRFLRMTLDHDSGDMEGDVLEGDYAGRSLASMSLEETVDLLNVCLRSDEASARVLESYLDRVYPHWRETEKTAGRRDDDTMGRQVAYEVLGLKPGATEKEIKAAHHRLISGLHPDHGGSTYLAAQINQAKDVLLKT